MTPKQKLLTFTVVLTLLALACALTPAPAPPPVDDPVDQNAIDTMVAETLAASGDDPGQSDGAGGGDDGDDSGGDDPAPADPTATFTPEPTATPTETPTNTPEPTDPPSAVDALGLGEPDVSYGFGSSNGPFYEYSQADSKVEAKDGTLQFTMYNAVSWTIWSFSSIELEDYYFEIDVKMPADCVGKDRGGIIFGTKPSKTDNGANYQISCDGKYRLFIYTGSETINLIPWSSHDNIIAGPNKTNRLGILHQDNKITLYMNGGKLQTITDDTYVGVGRIGINMGADEHDNVTIYFDNAAYWTTIP